MDGATEFVRVIARIRPSKQARKDNILSLSGNFISCGGDEKTFQFDHIFTDSSSQTEVFEVVGKRVVEGALEGYNGTIFAYGQTGSGKTHTMLGPSNVPNFFDDPMEKGLIPRLTDHLFESLRQKKSALGEEFTYYVSCTFVEVYNEVIYDLMRPSSSSAAAIRLIGDKKIIYQGATSEYVGEAVDLMRLLQRAWDQRRVAETAMNRESSRSHAVLVLDITMEEERNGITSKKEARLNLVDLAGSERQTHTNSVGVRLAEAGNINKSLSILGRVIRALSQPQGNGFIPYRDSKLTHMLKDSLGGNSRTAVIISLHPDREYLSDTLSTLQFSSNCRLVRNHACANRQVVGDGVMALRRALEEAEKKAEEDLLSLKKDHQRQLESVEGEKEKWLRFGQELQKKLDVILVENHIMRLELGARPEEGRETLENLVSDFIEKRCDILLTGPSVLDLEKEGMLIELETCRQECESLRSRCKLLDEESLKNSSMRFSTPSRQLTESFARTPKETRNRRRTRFTLSHQKPQVEAAQNESAVVLWGDDLVENVEQNSSNEQKEFELQCQISARDQVIAEQSATIDSLKDALRDKELENLSTISKLEDRLRLLESELVDNKGLYECASASNQKLEEKLCEFSTQLKERDECVRSLEDQIAQQCDDLDELRCQLNAKQVYLENAEKDLAALKQAQQNDLLQKDEAAVSLKLARDEYLAAAEKLEELQAEVNYKDRKLKEYEKTAKMLVEEMKKLKVELKKSSERCEELEFEMAEGSRLAAVLQMKDEELRTLEIDIKSKMKIHEQECARYERLLKDREADSKRYLDALQSQYDKLVADRDALRNQLMSMRSDFEADKENIESDFERKIKEMKEIFNQEKNSRLERERELEEQLEKNHEEISSLQRICAQDGELLSTVAGHANTRQKINVLNSLRNERNTLQIENEHLKAEIAKLRKREPAPINSPMRLRNRQTSKSRNN